MVEFFNTVIVYPFVNILTLFYRLFETFGVPGPFGWSIIGFTVAIRVLTIPLYKKQIETSQKMQDLKPQLDTVQKKHKDDRMKLQQETMRVYKEAGINPASGCFLALVQIPVFIGLYSALNFFIQNGETALTNINDHLYFSWLVIERVDFDFFIYSLTQTPSGAGQVVYYIIPLVTALFQYIQANTTPMGMMPSKPKEADQGKKDGKKEEPSTAEEFQRAMQLQMKYFFPGMIGFLSFTFPVGLSLYWNVFSIFSIIQNTMTIKKKQLPLEEKKKEVAQLESKDEKQKTDEATGESQKQKEEDHDSNKKQPAKEKKLKKKKKKNKKK